MLRYTSHSIAMLILLLASAGAYAQNDTGSPTDTRSEGYKIEQRVKWFYGSRGLDKIDRPDLRRQDAIDQVNAMRAEEASLAQTNPWEAIGPSPMTMLNWGMGNVSGRVSSITVHPTNSNIIYLGTAGGGLWKTTNGGTSWTTLTADLATQSVGSCFLDPSNPDVVWLGTGETNSSCAGYFGAGIFKSTNAGASFVASNGQGSRTLNLSFVASITAHASAPQTILASGHGYCSGGVLQTGGVYRSTDGGANWDRVLSGQGSDLISDPTDPNVFYAAIGKTSDANNGVYKSTNGGATWTRLSSGIDTGTAITRIRLAMAPSSNATLYAYTSGGKVFKTTNSGTSWTTTGTGACEGQCTYNLCMAVSPTNASTLLIGSIRFGRSTNSGQSLTYLTSTWGSSQKVHQDTHVLVYDRTDANKFWVGCDGGIWRTDNGGSTFVNLNANLNITQFYDIAVSPTDITRVWGGAQDNSSLGADNSVVWDVNLVTGDGFINLVDPRNPNNVFQTSYPGSTPSVYRSTTGGTPNSFSALSMAGVTNGSYAWVTPLAICTNTAKTATYLFVGGSKVFMSSNNGSNWSSLSSANLTTGSLSVIEALPDAARVKVYAGSSGGGIWRLDDALTSSTWSTVTGNYPGGNVSDIAADPANPNRVFVARGAFGASKLYRSTTGGTTWTAVGAGLPDVPANAVSIDPFDANRIFVGTDVGVFESIDNGDTFSTLMLGFPMGTVVTDLEISKTPHVLSAGTYGRGAWQVDLSEPTGNQAPTANFTFAANGLTVAFTDASTDADGTIASRAWNFGDGGTSTLTNPNRAYASAGTYTVTLTVTDNGGLTHTTSKSVTVSSGNQAPTANFTFTTSNLTATFTDSSTDPDGSIASRSWNFGDSTTSTATNPSKTYAAAGTYTVTLTVTDNGGLTHSTNKSVTVSTAPGGLTDGVAVTGISGAAGTWSYFFIDVPTGASSLTFTTSGGTGDADLYTKFGSQPTTTVNDCKSEGATTAESCTHANPAAGRWHVGVYHYAATSGVSLVADYAVTSCPPSSTSLASQSGTTGAWKHNTLTVPTCATTLNAAMSGGTGDADLYVRYNAQPTSTLYNCRPYKSGNAETCTISAPTAGTWYVSTYAYSTFSGVTLTYGYQ